ncbi:Prokaryotic diacylglycerol kinase [uncultured archaeon]|nr:Prokaryotic diacylglycerol kinase [uncultured archaeon]
MTRVSFIDSALCATRGLFRGISSERNIKIQLMIVAIIISTAILLQVSKIYLITIIIVCFLVIILELFNRGFEKLIDLISPEYNKEFGKVKDAMSGVVLLTFGMAVIVSFIILYEPIAKLSIKMYQHPFFLIFLIADILFVLILAVAEHRKKYRYSH